MSKLTQKEIATLASLSATEKRTARQSLGDSSGTFAVVNRVLALYQLEEKGLVSSEFLDGPYPRRRVYWLNEVQS